MSIRKLIKEVYYIDVAGKEGSGLFQFECHVSYFVSTNCYKICRFVFEHTQFFSFHQLKKRVFSNTVKFLSFFSRS